MYRVGIDLVDVPGFEARFTGRDDALGDVFTESELAYSRRQHDPWRHLAARFAAKEALLKALASGLTGAMRWRDIEVRRDPAGTPALGIGGATGEKLRGQGLVACSVSMSHTATCAVAVVVLVPSSA